MKQALHIFRKDVRQLWLPIIIVLLLTAAHAVFDVLRSPLDIPETARTNQMATLLSILLVLSWWYLIAIVVYQEPLPGDRQFWVTRPYSWKSLLGAKLLFILALFNVSLLISDCYILWAQHFPVLTNLSALLGRQLSLTLFLVVPSFVLATVTTGLAQFVMAWFLLLLGLLAETFLFHSAGGSAISIDTPGGQMESALLLVIAAGTILWQYVKRRTAVARAVLAISIFVVIPLLAAIPTSQRPRFIAYSDKVPQRVDPAKLNIAYNAANPSVCSSTGFSRPGFIDARLPLQIDNLPAETALLGITELRVIAPNFNYPNANAHVFSELQKKADHYCQVISLEPAQFERIKSQPVTLHTTLYLTAITNRPILRIPAQARTMTIPDVGICETYTGFGQALLLCRAGVYSPEATLVSIEYPGFHSEPARIGNFHPDHDVTGGLSPVEKWITDLGNPNDSSAQIREALLRPDAQLVFTRQRPLGYGIKSIEVQNLNLAAYASIR